MITVIDYDAGNLASVETALSHLGASFETSSDYRRVLRAGKIIFPGVGHAAHAMSALQSRNLDGALVEAVQKGTPVLGICLGSQIILEHSDEGETPCLALARGSVRDFAAVFEKQEMALKVPHIGWNQVNYEEKHPAAPLFRGIPQGSSFYFVHSLYPQPTEQAHVLGWTDYGISFPSAFGKENLIACQFHPEKSGEPGLALLNNFIRFF